MVVSGAEFTWIADGDHAGEPITEFDIERGLKDLDQLAPPGGRVRRAGSGRRRLTAKDPTLLEDLRRLVEPVTLGDPMRPLLWVSKSHVKLAKALRRMSHTLSPNTVRKLLRQLGYDRRVNRKAN